MTAGVYRNTAFDIFLFSCNYYKANQRTRGICIGPHCRGVTATWLLCFSVRIKRCQGRIFVVQAEVRQCTGIWTMWFGFLCYLIEDCGDPPRALVFHPCNSELSVASKISANKNKRLHSD